MKNYEIPVLLLISIFPMELCVKYYEDCCMLIKQSVLNSIVFIQVLSVIGLIIHFNRIICFENVRAIILIN